MNNILLAITPPAIADDTFDSMMQKVIDTFSVEKITGILGSILTGAAPYVLLWFGIRKSVRALFGAAKKGRVRF